MQRLNGIIGHTGFVGGHLLRQHQFDGLFNSRNVHEAADTAFDMVVCAAAPGSMFKANKSPDNDWEEVSALIEQLALLKARRFVLISSIAVLTKFARQADERTGAFEKQLAYGRHRRALEAFCEAHFDDCLIVRLPALFGAGLRKNFIFDLLNPVPTMLTEDKLRALRAGVSAELAVVLDKVYTHDPAINMQKLDRAALSAYPGRAALETAVVNAGQAATQFHNPETTYQYYNMTRLWADIVVAREAELDVIHLATEPQTAGRIHARLLGGSMPETGAHVVHEDMHTRHAGLWSRSGPYIDDADSVLDQLAAFFEDERSDGS